MGEIKALVVDDTEINLMIMKQALKNVDCESDTANSGSAAVELIKDNKYDIIFMDYLMPGMDGVETTQCIRAMDGDYFNSVPIIAITGDTSDEVQELFKRAGINDFMEKPVMLDALSEQIEKHVKVLD